MFDAKATRVVAQVARFILWVGCKVPVKRQHNLRRHKKLMRRDVLVVVNSLHVLQAKLHVSIIAIGLQMPVGGVARVNLRLPTVIVLIVRRYFAVQKQELGVLTGALISWHRVPCLLLELVFHAS